MFSTWPFDEESTAHLVPDTPCISLYNSPEGRTRNERKAMKGCEFAAASFKCIATLRIKRERASLRVGRNSATLSVYAVTKRPRVYWRPRCSCWLCPRIPRWYYFTTFVSVLCFLPFNLQFASLAASSSNIGTLCRSVYRFDVRIGAFRYVYLRPTRMDLVRRGWKSRVVQRRFDLLD